MGRKRVGALKSESSYLDEIHDLLSGSSRCGVTHSPRRLLLDVELTIRQQVHKAGKNSGS